jgi:hypothetical protein
MTNLEKAVRRRTLRAFDHHGRRLIVEFAPGDVLIMREERRKASVKVSLQTLYVWLVQRDAVERVRKYEKRTKELIKAGLDRRTAKRQAREEAGL